MISPNLATNPCPLCLRPQPGKLPPPHQKPPAPTLQTPTRPPVCMPLAPRFHTLLPPVSCPPPQLYKLPPPPDPRPHTPLRHYISPAPDATPCPSPPPPPAAPKALPALLQTLHWPYQADAAPGKQAAARPGVSLGSMCCWAALTNAGSCYCSHDMAT